MKKTLLLTIMTLLLSTSVSADVQQAPSAQIQEKLTTLEKSFDGKIGIYAIDTNDNQNIGYRSDERFPVQSTCKLIGVAALLKQSNTDKDLLKQKINYTKNDLIFWCPITKKYLENGMALTALAEAAMTYSDNAAMNLIMKKLGGPKSVTSFANTIDNKTFNIEHYEGDLNSNPNDNHDTSTPKDMAISLQKLTLGDVLSPSIRTQLVTWMRNNTTGNKRIRAGAPIGWVVADKTGSGEYGIANDIGILWSPTCKPIVLAIYTVQNKQDAKSRDDVVASAASILLGEFAKNDSCFQSLD